MTFGLGYAEIAIIVVIALLVIGPRRLPELMRTVGKVMGQLRRASDDLRREVLFGDEISAVKDAVNPFTPPPVPPKIRTKPKSDSENEETPPEPGDPSPEQKDRREEPDGQ